MEENLKVNIEEITLENFRGIRGRSTLKLHEKLTALVSDNGAGKTTVLDALALLLSNCLEALGLLPNGSRLSMRPTDNNNLAAAQGDYFHLSAQLRTRHVAPDWDVADNIEAQNALNNGSGFWVKAVEKRLSIELKAGKKTPEPFQGAELYEIASEIREYQELRKKHSGVRDPNAYPLPVVAYYRLGANRQATGTSSQGSIDNNAEIYRDCLWLDLSESSRQLFEWFRWTDRMMRQELPNPETKQLLEIKTRQIDWIRTAVLLFLNDVLPEPESIEKESWRDFKAWDRFDHLAIVYDELHPEGSFAFRKASDGGILHEDQLSSGERHLFALVADLAFRLVMANYHSHNPLRGSGIVLIDEVDLHLHPRWQRKVLHRLNQTFPGLQFVVSTHSLAATQNLDGPNIRIMPDSFNADLELHTLGRDLNAVAAEAFDLTEEPEEQHALFEKRSRLKTAIRAADFDSAQELLASLQEKWGANSPEITALRSSLELAQRSRAPKREQSDEAARLLAQLEKVWENEP